MHVRAFFRHVPIRPVSNSATRVEPLFMDQNMFTTFKIITFCTLWVSLIVWLLSHCVSRSKVAWAKFKFFELEEVFCKEKYWTSFDDNKWNDCYIRSFDMIILNVTNVKKQTRFGRSLLATRYASLVRAQLSSISYYFLYNMDRLHLPKIEEEALI